MNEARLKRFIERPEVQRYILDGYHGDYSLGIAINPATSSIAIRVRVSGNANVQIPDHITLEGETVPILVSPNFKSPVPLGH